MSSVLLSPLCVLCKNQSCLYTSLFFCSRVFQSLCSVCLVSVFVFLFPGLSWYVLVWAYCLWASPVLFSQSCVLCICSALLPFSHQLDSFSCVPQVCPLIYSLSVCLVFVTLLSFSLHVCSLFVLQPLSLWLLFSLSFWYVCFVPWTWVIKLFWAQSCSLSASHSYIGVLGSQCSKHINHFENKNKLLENCCFKTNSHDTFYKTPYGDDLVKS